MPARFHAAVLPAIALTVVLTAGPAPLLAQRADQPAAAAQTPNSDPTYQQLRRIGLDGEASSADGLKLQRDAGTFNFRSGAFHFLAPVAGKCTGAVFIGEGSFTLNPTLETEKRSLALLTKQPGMTEEFHEAVFRFTDGTCEEIRKKAGASPGNAGNAASVLSEVNDRLRKTLHRNLHARILEDVLSPEPGGLFVAFIHGRKYSSKMAYLVDPHGISDVAPEEVALLTYEEGKQGIWMASHLAEEYASSTATGAQKNATIRIERQQLDTQIERSGKLNGTAVTTFVSQYNGVRVVPFDLYPTLRVQSVTDAGGQPLAFIQEGKDDDPQFAVILPKALRAGETCTIKTVYSGKDAIRNEGGQNYYPVARSTWYPNTSLGDYADYEMRFAIPKELQIVATGVRVSEATEGGQNLSVWKSDGRQTVAGFQFGKFKREEKRLEALGFEVETYANLHLPDDMNMLQHLVESAKMARVNIPATLGALNTTDMMKKAMAEAEVAVTLYTDYFGTLPYKRLAMTQQTAMNFGQAWPELIFLPMSYFFDSTIRHQLGMDDPKGYFSIVGPHEVAHQWWGHTVTWISYRDQWMSEGFSEFSASLFLQSTRPDLKDYLKFWNDEREFLLEKNRYGNRPIDVGPLTMGYRLSNTKSGFDITRRLIYPKGGYILHMLRMMMWNPKTGDDFFKAMLKDFLKTYYNQPATTEDFKAMVEKHMTPEMNLEGNGRMDWFFDQYVYGTALPDYDFRHNFSADASGNVILNVSLQQSNVDDRFRMRVPIYLELANGRVVRLGSATVIGNKKLEQSIPLAGLKDRPKRAMVNYFHDVLCTERSK